MWSCLQAASWVISFCRICVPIVRTPPLSTIATCRKRTGRTAAIHAWGWNIKSCSTSIRSRPSTSKIGCDSVGRTPAASGCVIPISIPKSGGPTPGCARLCGTSWRLMSRHQSCCTPVVCAPKKQPQVFARTLHQLVSHTPQVVALVAGDGPDLGLAADLCPPPAACVPGASTGCSLAPAHAATDGGCRHIFSALGVGGHCLVGLRSHGLRFARCWGRRGRTARVGHCRVRHADYAR